MVNLKNKVIEIESYWGHTIGAIETDEDGDIIRLFELEHNDDDGDYIFGTDKTLLRISCTKVVNYDNKPG